MIYPVQKKNSQRPQPNWLRILTSRNQPTNCMIYQKWISVRNRFGGGLNFKATLREKYIVLNKKKHVRQQQQKNKTKKHVCQFLTYYNYFFFYLKFMRQRSKNSKIKRKKNKFAISSFLSISFVCASQLLFKK
jgi:hypothetical protein